MFGAANFPAGRGKEENPRGGAVKKSAYIEIVNEVFVVFYEGKHYILSFLKDISVQNIVKICTKSQMKIFSYFSSSEA